MKFHEKLNEYISELGCTGKDISSHSGLSASSLSRYRSGERVPAADSETFSNLCIAIEYIASAKGMTGFSSDKVKESFLSCDNITSVDKEQLIKNFNVMISTLNLNLSKLCRFMNYDTSTVFRFRNGTRQPSDPEQFATDIATYISYEADSEIERASLAGLIEKKVSEIENDQVRCYTVKNWLLHGTAPNVTKGNISDFLSKLDDFDLNKYIKAIHFDEMKVPSFPFLLPTSKMYYGLDEMMESELDFLKATVLSKSMKPVTLYSDMPMTEMAKDPDFPKKWMYGMALMLKKGLHLNNIHNIGRSFDEMMLGLESWIPMYMTGQISPYYLKGTQNNVFNHFLRVSGAAALSGEAISGHHSEGRYYLSKTKEDIAYYQKRADNLIENAYPLMDIYRFERERELKAFMLTDAGNSGSRRSILSAPPLYTIDKDSLESLLIKHSVPSEDAKRILDFAASQRDNAIQILTENCITDELPLITEEEFKLHPIVLPLSGMFYESDITYTYKEYVEHIEQSKKFAELHKNYTVGFTKASPFRNLQIIIHEGQWAMISKGNSPAIHFVIHHPKLRNAIENFVPPVVD